MSIFSMVFASRHLRHALNRGVHHLERSETSRRRPRHRRASCLPGCVQHSCSCDRTAPARFNAINRAMTHGSNRHAAPACSEVVYVVSTRIDGRRQRHGNVMASVRIVDRFQDTAGIQEPRRGEIFHWRGEMHAKFACVRSPTAGKQRSGTALLRRGVCTMFGEAGKRP